MAGTAAHESRVPGGVARIDLGPATGAVAPEAWFDEHRVLVMATQGRWQALVGLPLSLQPGTQRLVVAGMTPTEARREISFAVGDKSYPVQRLKIRDRRKVEPLAEDLARIEREAQHTGELKTAFTALATPETELQLPADGPLSSRFGLRRIFNGLPRQPHAGLDVMVPVGSVVRTAAGGTVIDTSDYFFNGRSVFIDHGQGLITLYCHLDRIDVRPGERVERGQPLGLSGASGRATGPHLHWSVFLNGTAVDPELLLSP